MRLRIRELNDLTQSERSQLKKNSVWAADSDEDTEDRWLVTLENKSLVISFLVPKTEDVPVME
jgi:hypothetical protein